MTYVAFLAIFLGVPLVVLGALQARTIRWPEVVALMGVGAIALLYTTPWDDVIIRQGVWSYPPGRVLGITIGQVPLEECLFYLLQVSLGALAWRAVNQATRLHRD
jgi:lycopene cyclase domain-containing protein